MVGRQVQLGRGTWAVGLKGRGVQRVQGKMPGAILAVNGCPELLARWCAHTVCSSQQRSARCLLRQVQLAASAYQPAALTAEWCRQ